MQIGKCESIDKFKDELKKMTDGEIIAQEIVQKGAVYALRRLLTDGCTPERCSELLDQASRLALHIQDECRKRGVPTVDWLESAKATDQNPENKH